MSYPRVRYRSAEVVPVEATCRALGFSKQELSKGQALPRSDRRWADVHLVDAALAVCRDESAFGYRFTASELGRRGHRAVENRVWRLRVEQPIRSVFSKDGLSRKSGYVRITISWTAGSCQGYWTGCG